MKRAPPSGAKSPIDQLIAERVISAKPVTDAVGDVSLLSKGRVGAQLKSSGRLVELHAIRVEEAVREIHLMKQFCIDSAYFASYINSFFGKLVEVDPEPRLWLSIERMQFALSDVHRDRQPMPEPINAAIIRSVVRGLAVLHDSKVIHRAIAPAAVQISATGIAKICDLEHSVSLDESNRRPLPQSLFNSEQVQFCSPELLASTSSPTALYSTKTDVWSTVMLAIWLHDGETPLASLGATGARSTLTKLATSGGDESASAAAPFTVRRAASALFRSFIAGGLSPLVDVRLSSAELAKNVFVRQAAPQSSVLAFLNN